ncbi:hypothetical protein D0T49_01165 [Paludibacter sp. 221]|uniref:hypothetical protein n=1 Tax=Paludibacter sp. 221 TaxID=2302939 RepID=UPI0013D24D75|nr:hypothetical protein [Paludibacter sp. 221]NDV45660.1 hypothetical protein [Paludibacter sp. 221]
MKKIFTITFLFFILTHISAQSSFEGGIDIDLSKLEQLQTTQNDKINAAFAAMEAVQKASAYIESLTDLFSNQKLTLPVGIKQGDYELIVHRIINDRQTGKAMLYATCAFKFKDTGQRIAFEGQVAIKGRNGFGTSGQLALIAPVQRKIGNQATLVVREGTVVRFGCEGIESFDAKMTWLVTSDKIIPTDEKGIPTNRKLGVAFDATFKNFDSYLVSLNVNQSFMVKGLNDIVFTLKGATLDQSDTETSSMTRFPAQYFAQQSDEQVKLWKGLAVTEASVSLPAVFKKPESAGDERITLSLYDVLFDENGFTANAEVKDIISSDALNKEDWSMSLTDFSLGFLKNQVVAFGFGGDINMPPFGKNSLFPYMATFNPTIEEYEFKVGLTGEYEFPALYSTLTLNELSTIDILLKDANFYPKIQASGFMTVNAPLGEDSTEFFSVPEIAFENMVISREAPYFELGAIGVSGELSTPSIAGFELSISDIRPFRNDKGSGLGFQAGISLNKMFSGTAGMQLYGDYQKWKFREVAVDKVHIDFSSPAFSLKGGVWFKNGDALFGSGFRGDVKLGLLDGQFNFDAIGVFGKVDNYHYFLTDVFFDAGGMGGIPVPPVLSFNGFGGGLYHRMQQSSKLPGNVEPSDLAFGQALSGISYLPDKNVGMGVMASTSFGLLSSPDAFNAKVGFEMQFNNSGGVNFVQLRGEASFMAAADKLGTLSDNIVADMAKREAIGKAQPEKANKEELANKVPDIKTKGSLTAGINIEYDFINKVFSADLNTYLNAGIIRGIGANDRMGWASAHFSPEKWYVYMGTPTDRLGVEILKLAKTTGYFMLGDDIPALPPPPQKVLDNLSQDKIAKLARSSNVNMAMGKGIAFGTSFETNFNATLTPFYARMGVGLGVEFMLTNLNGSSCANYLDIPGINGWFANAQAWAYVQAAIGMEAKVFGKTRGFNILDISAGTLLQGSGPNPLYLAGAVGGRFSVLGGLVSGNCKFDFEIGEKCILSEGSPFGEDIIAQLTPNPNAKDVNVFAAPQVIFNVPVDLEMIIDEEDTKGTYKVTLEELSVKYKDGRNVSGDKEFSDDGNICMFTPSEPFESKKDMEVYAKVGFMKKLNGKWEHVKGGDGKPVFEDKKTTFVTGDRPKEIMPEHVKYSYPIDRQYNFYVDEYKQGYILVSQNYSYLFSTEKPEGFNQILRVTDSNGNKHETAFSYRSSSSIDGVRMEIDFSLEQVPLQKEEIYQLAIVNVPKETNASISSNISTQSSAIEGNQDISVTRRQATETITLLNEKEIYALHFRTSKYNTFSEKIKVFDKKENGWRYQIEPYVHDIGLNLSLGHELFDKYEIQGINERTKLIHLSAQLDKTSWFEQSLYPHMYSNQNISKTGQNTNHDYGVPPAKAMKIITSDVEKRLTDDEINLGISVGFDFRGNIYYSIPFWCSRDFYNAKNNIAKKITQGKSASIYELELMNTNAPASVLPGNYPVNVSYILPGREIVTTKTNITVFNPVGL